MDMSGFVPWVLPDDFEDLRSSYQGSSIYPQPTDSLLQMEEGVEPAVLPLGNTRGWYGPEWQADLWRTGKHGYT